MESVREYFFDYWGGYLLSLPGDLRRELYRYDPILPDLDPIVDATLIPAARREGETLRLYVGVGGLRPCECGAPHHAECHVTDHEGGRIRAVGGPKRKTVEGIESRILPQTLHRTLAYNLRGKDREGATVRIVLTRLYAHRGRIVGSSEFRSEVTIKNIYVESWVYSYVDDVDSGRRSLRGTDAEWGAWHMFFVNRRGKPVFFYGALNYRLRGLYDEVTRLLA